MNTDKRDAPKGGLLKTTMRTVCDLTKILHLNHLVNQDKEDH